MDLTNPIDWLDWQQVNTDLWQFLSMFTEYSVWLVGGLIAVVHHYLFKFLRRRAMRYAGIPESDTTPAPLWAHVIVFHLSFAITILIVWLFCLAVT